MDQELIVQRLFLADLASTMLKASGLHAYITYDANSSCFIVYTKMKKLEKTVECARIRVSDPDSAKTLSALLKFISESKEIADALYSKPVIYQKNGNFCVTYPFEPFTKTQSELASFDIESLNGVLRYLSVKGSDCRFIRITQDVYDFSEDSLENAIENSKDFDPDSGYFVQDEYSDILCFAHAEDLKSFVIPALASVLDKELEKSGVSALNDYLEKEGCSKRLYL
ncbi:MAG: hypothetical protein ACI4UM_09000 [Succinivibrio sp.]